MISLNLDGQTVLLSDFVNLVKNLLNEQAVLLDREEFNEIDNEVCPDSQTRR